MSDDEKRLEALVPKRLECSAWGMAYEAASLRLALEKGSVFLKACCDPQIKKLKETKWARANDPSGRWSDHEFLERFSEAHAHGFDWQEDARQGEIEDRIRKQEDQQFAQEHAEDARWKMACATKFYTPSAPDAWLLCTLAWEYRRSRGKQRRIIRRTWPTLRELNLATAIPERTLIKIINRLQPKEGEIIRGPLRLKFSKRGALPLCYGPRLIVGVLGEFVERLPEFPIDDGEKKRLQKTALLVKRAFAARWGCSR